MLKEDLNAKWAPLLDHADLGAIKDKQRRDVTAVLLENTERELGEAHAMASTANGGQSLLGEAAPTNATGSAVANFDPVLISLVRRAMPNLMAYDVCGVQPMTGPTGLIFAMRSRYANQTGAEAFYQEANTGFSTAANTTNQANTAGGKHAGTSFPAGANLAGLGLYNWRGGEPTAQLEGGFGATGTFPEMAFSIEKVLVEAKGRALKAEYSLELAQDLKAVHGLDAETELSNILSTEILAEINREVIRTILVTAVPGSQEGTTTAGVFDLDTDSNGRWLAEKFKGLMFQVEREANKISKDTRRGKGNIVICSSDVASALQMAGVLDYAPALNSNSLSVDDTGNTFAGVLNGRYKVYIDPYAGANYMVIGYKGANKFDAGLFYCPYVPLQMVRAVDPNNFQPKIGFKTRYGMAPNPFAKGALTSHPQAQLEQDSNVYYRRTVVQNIM